jgi:hypothetical protein
MKALDRERRKKAGVNVGFDEEGMNAGPWPYGNGQSIPRQGAYCSLANRIRLSFEG